MFEASIGILLLCICLLALSQRDHRRTAERAYSKGFEDGAKCILEMDYKALEDFENEKD